MNETFNNNCLILSIFNNINFYKEYLIVIFIFLCSNCISKNRFFYFLIGVFLVFLEIQIKFTSIYFKIIKIILKYLYALLYLPFIPLIFYILTALHLFFDFLWTMYILISINLLLIFSLPYYLWCVFFKIKFTKIDLIKSNSNYAPFALKLFSSCYLFLSINFKIASITKILLSLYETFKFIHLETW